MTKPLATTEAEIAKLPDGVYRCADGSYVENIQHRMHYLEPVRSPSTVAALMHAVAKANGGIACRLVPATDRDELEALLGEVWRTVVSVPIGDGSERARAMLKDLLKSDLAERIADTLAKLEGNDAQV